MVMTNGVIDDEKQDESTDTTDLCRFSLGESIDMSFKLCSFLAQRVECISIRMGMVFYLAYLSLK